MSGVRYTTLAVTLPTPPRSRRRPHVVLWGARRRDVQFGSWEDIVFPPLRADLAREVSRELFFGADDRDLWFQGETG